MTENLIQILFFLPLSIITMIFFIVLINGIYEHKSDTVGSAIIVLIILILGGWFLLGGFVTPHERDYTLNPDEIFQVKSPNTIFLSTPENIFVFDKAVDMNVINDKTLFYVYTRNNFYYMEDQEKRKCFYFDGNTRRYSSYTLPLKK